MWFDFVECRVIGGARKVSVLTILCAVCALVLLYFATLFLYIVIYYDEFDVVLSDSGSDGSRSISSAGDHSQTPGPDLLAFNGEALASASLHIGIGNKSASLQLSLKDECHMQHAECFDVNRCDVQLPDDTAADKQQEHHARRSPLRVFVFEPRRLNSTVLRGHMSDEFSEFVATLLQHGFYEPEARKACLFVPLVDLLNENRWWTAAALSNASDAALASLWRDDKRGGRNHLLFNMLPRETATASVDSATRLTLGSGAAILTSSAFEARTYRRGFDVSVPLWNPFTARLFTQPVVVSQRHYWLVSTQIGLSEEQLPSLLFELKQQHRRRPPINDRDDEYPQAAAPTLTATEVGVFDVCAADSFNYLERCRAGRSYVYSLAALMSNAHFCLVVKLDSTRWTRDQRHTPGAAAAAAMTLFDALKFNCVPVIVSDDWVLPFSERLDWTQLAVRVRPEHVMHGSANRGNAGANALHDTLAALRADPLRLRAMLSAGKRAFDAHFASIQLITLTVLDVIQSRLEPTRRSLSSSSSSSVDESAAPEMLLVGPYVSADQRQGGGFTVLLVVRLKRQRLFSGTGDSIVELVRRSLRECALLDRVLLLLYAQSTTSEAAVDLQRLIDRLNLEMQPTRSAPLSAGGDQRAAHSRVFLKLMEMSGRHRASSKYFRFSEIRTEAVLVLHATRNGSVVEPAHIQSAYQVWRRFPDRLVRLDTEGAAASTAAAQPFFYNVLFDDYLLRAKRSAVGSASAQTSRVQRQEPRQLDWLCEDVLMQLLVARTTLKSALLVRHECGKSSGNTTAHTIGDWSPQQMPIATPSVLRRCQAYLTHYGMSAASAQALPHLVVRYAHESETIWF